MSNAPESHLSTADLQRFREALVAKRGELIAAQHASTAEQRGVHERETEQGDVAEHLIEQEASLRIAHFDATLLADVDRALGKLEAGQYGISEDTGEPIPLERLELIPWARRNVQEEEAAERA